MTDKAPLRLTLQASEDTEITGRISAHVSAISPLSTGTKTDALYRPPTPSAAAPLVVAPMAIQLTGPSQAAVGKPAVFEIRVTNQSSQPLTGIVLFGTFPEGLNTPQGREIEGAVDVSFTGAVSGKRGWASSIGGALVCSARGWHKACGDGGVRVQANAGTGQARTSNNSQGKRMPQMYRPNVNQ